MSRMPTATAPKKTPAKKIPAKKAPAKKLTAKPVPMKTEPVVLPAPTVPVSLRILQLGNFGPPHSTENHLYRALVGNGHEVTQVLEPVEQCWSNMADMSRWPVSADSVDVIIWTKTDTRESLTENTFEKMRRFLQIARNLGIPVVAYHLDIWWGLKREEQVRPPTMHPFFESTLVCTADGGHDDRWAESGVNHVWFPPGVSVGECELGQRNEEFVSPLAFVGSWDGSYHPESEHRMELVRWLRRNFRRDCAFWPRPGEHAIRGEALRDLYASVDVVVGDSCFAGTLPRYWSDRIPETLGRGGFLLHPNVPGIEDHFTIGSDLWAWEAGNWEQLGVAVEAALMLGADGRREIAMHGRATVLRDHTYERRMLQLVELLAERDLL